MLFDKTGTLTQGKPIVTDVIVREGLSEEELLHITASIENHSTHPLASAIVQYAKKTYNIQMSTPEQMEDITGFGLKGTLNGIVYKIGKSELYRRKCRLICRFCSRTSCAARENNCVYK
ncbi:hypothetical protein GCM10020331_014390 [Ectobacillus funiculus]